MSGKPRTIPPGKGNPIRDLAVRVQEIVNDEIIAYRAAGPGWEPHHQRSEEVARLADAAFTAGVEANLDVALLDSRIRCAVSAVDHLLWAAMAGIDRSRPRRRRPTPKQFGKSARLKAREAAAGGQGYPEWARIEKPVADAFLAAEGLLVLAAALDVKRKETADREAVRRRIPPEKRTRPLSMGEAATFMGYTRHRKKKQAVKLLRAAIDDRTVTCERRTRQQYIFHLDDFPKESHGRVAPKQN
jgi:hypothetical protein